MPFRLNNGTGPALAHAGSRLLETERNRCSPRGHAQRNRPHAVAQSAGFQKTETLTLQHRMCGGIWRPLHSTSSRQGQPAANGNDTPRSTRDGFKGINCNYSGGISVALCTQPKGGSPYRFWVPMEEELLGCYIACFGGRAQKFLIATQKSLRCCTISLQGKWHG